ncbi:hypothetical protein NT2_08_00040 [Caenibius tardaugens NBRC 16725]|uniref:DUF6306 domain-containing protein n=1 Tax=Caenibius tardaugens NBRC 16725 TaxID=1219035 RepID=U2YNQ6_9SPHN|nr:DUF6306 domain-containing protein [Caenibius tardaugens]AZI35039.1 hypothetical protein EGO55_02930 [Caenibius tardaugens NBRC 16725]GAD50217.1 hypothetical protein NT2_08_00040 [Caenibius tardaugens NBRC 16725]
MPDDEPSSPVCYANEADAIYMGYAGRDELIAALTELLEAERAGDRIAHASTKDAPDTGYGDLMRAVRGDEAHWCAMLARYLKRLDATVSTRCGAFHQKAMAIADPWERLAFLNRGQQWVVRKLETLMPRVRDDGLYADLRKMRDSHRVNITMAEMLLNSPDGPSTPA